MRFLLMVSALAVAAPAFAQPAGKVAQDAAMTPVEDVNIKKKEIPAVLLSAEQDPYSAESTRNCAQLSVALGELDTVLGPDFDSGAAAKNATASRVAKSVVGSFIPFRGVIREVSGAAGAQRRYDAAVDAGIARRGYLRGIARTKGCKRAPAVTAAAN
ncbi:hypothetical protein ACFSCW_03180 [Sphingomonas tabacisoli]|uniref:UrcA family protein n=1 Tax=Sphingomonas tabacisoli TaxID=2249466 RepID=A0ABW4I0Q7_9SPHN